MAEIDSSYQTNAGKIRDGVGFFLKEAGYFKFFDEDVLGPTLRNLAFQAKSYRITNYSTAATKLSDLGGSAPPVLPSRYGTIFIEASDGGTNLSARLCSAYSGQILEIILMAGSVASVMILFSGDTAGDGIAGVNVIGLEHSAGASALSSISMRQSAASYARLVLKGLDSGSWAVVEIDSPNNITEQRA